MCAVGCGAVTNLPATDGPARDGTVADASVRDSSVTDALVTDGPPAEMPRTYSGTMAATPLKAYGGSGFCNYTITLKMLDVELGILPSSSRVISGHVQDLNVEALATGTTCPAPPIPPTIANYSFTSAAPTASGMTLTFQGAAANNPGVTLFIDLALAGTTYTATLRFHRSDQGPPVDWAVTVPLPLSAT
jgi:hypothetical protein